jgi:anaerobic selenocysteine-containing dehydrogenase
LLRASELASGGDARHYIAWDAALTRPVPYDPSTGRYAGSTEHLALNGEFSLAGRGGMISCRPVFDLYAELCGAWSPEAVEATCWLPRDQVEEAARLIWQARPVAYYAWSGHEQHANTTQTARAMALLYALTGSFDRPGGNVLLPSVPAAPITGQDLPAAKAMAPVIGLAERPLGPARFNFVSAEDFYRAALEDTPYPMRGLIGFGHNMLVARSDPMRGRAALAALDFYAHADLFMSPTAAMADVVLPIASCFEREALKIGFEISEEAQSLVQYRQAVVPPRGSARSDTDVIFDLARRLGLAEQFWDGDIDAAYRHQLKPSGISLEQLRAEPAGIRVPLTTKHCKHTELDPKGDPRGFATPSRKVEFWSDTLQHRGQEALPLFIEPRIGPVAAPAVAARFPLVLTCAKPTLFCQTQHHALPSLRKRHPHPEVEIHSSAAAARGLVAGDWVSVETQAGAMRARVHLNDQLDPRVVVGEHGWWQGCDELGIPGYDPFSSESANFNATVDPSVRDPISGTPAHRANLCEIRRLTAT